MDDIISEAKFVSSENDKRLRKEVLRSDLFETDLRLGNSDSTVAQTRANALMDGRNNLYYIGKNKGNGIPPTQVNTEVSQSAVSDTAFSNPSIADSAQNTTSAMLNESLHAPKINGIFDKKIGTPSNPAPQNIVNDYIDYSLEYSKQTKQLGNMGFPKQRISIDFGTADNRLATDLKKQGVDVSGYHHYLVDNDIRHINNSHGIGTNEKIPGNC